MYGKPKPSMKVLRELSSPLEVQSVHPYKKGKLGISIFGSLGLPQHIAKGYKLYLSGENNNYQDTKPYALPSIMPGEHLDMEVEDLFSGKGVVTIVRPNGYVVTQKSFY